LSFVERFFRKEPDAVTQKDVEEFIKSKVEENLNLDYTDIATYQHFDELSKEVSAFANSEGGLVMLGVSEESIDHQRIFPKEITWGDKKLSKEKLEDNLIAKIHPRIDGLRILPIRKTDDSVIFLIDIPQGINPPYMADDKRYYKRLNFRRETMEHYEIADLFGKRRRPLLALILTLDSVTLEDNQFKCTLRFFLANRGKATAKHFGLAASVFHAQILSQDQRFHRLDKLRVGTPSIQFSENLGVLHPHSRNRTHLGDITLKMLDATRPVVIVYQVDAEDMFSIEGYASFDCAYLTMAMKDIQEGKEVQLTTKEGSQMF
jgi:hypothetical protein